jgi:phosphatidylglycerophosphate synthase
MPAGSGEQPEPVDENKEHTQRHLLAISASFERRFLPWMALRLPPWVTPDGLTAWGLISAVLILISYLLAINHPAWLWGASVGLVLHWYFDSLDGTLARVRKIERPNYGYYIDHMADVIASLAILIGLGSTPWMRLSTALFVLSGYLAMSVHTHVYAHVTGVFQMGKGGLGPTEIRLILILGNTATWIWPTFEVPLGPLGSAAIMETLGWVCVVGFVVMLGSSMIPALRELGRLEPPRKGE